MKKSMNREEVESLLAGAFTAERAHFQERIEKLQGKIDELKKAWPNAELERKEVEVERDNDCLLSHREKHRSAFQRTSATDFRRKKFIEDRLQDMDRFTARKATASEISRLPEGAEIIEGAALELEILEKTTADCRLANFEDGKCNAYTIIARIETKGYKALDAEKLKEAIAIKITEAIDECHAKGAQQ